MYWWRVVMGNGHSVSIPGLATDNVPARAAVAAIRLWGNMWSNADTVIIHLDTLLLPLRHPQTNITPEDFL